MLETDLHECIIVKMDILNETVHVCMYIVHALLFAPMNLQISTSILPTMHYNNIIIFDPFRYCLCLFTANYKCTFQTNFIAVSIEYHFIYLLFYLFVYFWPFLSFLAILALHFVLEPQYILNCFRFSFWLLFSRCFFFLVTLNIQRIYELFIHFM